VAVCVLGVSRDGQAIYSRSQDFCLFGFGWGVGVEGGGEKKKLLQRGHLELLVFRVACVDDERAFGFPEE
jgi:hypothetical protein